MEQKPSVGQDFTVVFNSPETLVGATVTIEYKKPDRTIETNVTPTNVDTAIDQISYKIPKEDSVAGKWLVVAKIINAAGDVSWTKPPESVNFVDRFKV